MQLTIKKYFSVSFLRRTTFVFGMLFISFLLNAQKDENKATVFVDTTEVQPPPPEEETAEEEGSGTTKKYFYAKWDTLLVNQRNLPGDEVKKMKEDDDFWYANADIKKKNSRGQVEYEREQGKKQQKEQKENAIKEQQTQEQDQGDTYQPIGQRSWFQILLWIVILVVFAAVIIMYLGGSNVGLFRKKNIATGNVEEDVITEDIFAINYQKEIDKAAAQGNYRLAIRLMFLRVLKNMSEKNIIRYKQDKTNLDYLMELHPTNYYNSFFKVTRNYEYSWYGQFNVSEEAYKVIRSEFDHFEKELR